jgi:hypothetical protein
VFPSHSQTVAQQVPLNAAVFLPPVRTPVTDKDFARYLRDIRFNPPNLVTKYPGSEVVIDNRLSSTPSKKAAAVAKRNNFGSIETSPSQATVKRKQAVNDLRGVAKTRKVLEAHKILETHTVPKTIQQEITSPAEQSLDSNRPFIHQICGRGFSSLENVYDHHAGPADGTSGCWIRHHKPNITW